MKKYLNVGCGTRFLKDWTNIDFTSTGEGVISHDLRKGIPFPDCSFDFVYHSHVLEHFTKKEAELLLQECYRVLRPQGILRVAVPDLEKLAKTYLTALENSCNGSDYWAANYEWTVVHLYDQSVRNYSGGAMAEYIMSAKDQQNKFLLETCGSEVNKIITVYKNKYHYHFSDIFKISVLKRLLQIFFSRKLYINYPRDMLIKLILGKEEYNSLKIGRFRQSGEVHQWMYDRYSLSNLLKKCGFDMIIQRQAQESYLIEWSQFNLDTEPNNIVYRPDSLFMECIKPLP